MNPLIIAGGAAGALVLVDYFSRGASGGASVKPPITPGQIGAQNCGAYAMTQTRDQSTLASANVVLTDLIAQATVGRTSGQYGDFIDDVLGAAQRQLAAGDNSILSPDLGETQDAIKQLAVFMDINCNMNATIPGWFTWDDPASTGIGGALKDGAAWTIEKAASVVASLVPGWAWVALVVGGLVVGGFFLVRLGVI